MKSLAFLQLGVTLVICLRYYTWLFIKILGASWFHSDELQDMDGTATVIPRRENLDIVNVTQLDKDSILVCYDNLIRIVNPQGKLKNNKKQVNELRFGFKIESISKSYLAQNVCKSIKNVIFFFSLSSG